MTQNSQHNIKDQRENLGDIGSGNIFLDPTPKVWSMKEKIDKQDFIKI